jgi:hypothetical protein
VHMVFELSYPGLGRQIILDRQTEKSVRNYDVFFSNIPLLEESISVKVDHFNMKNDRIVGSFFHDRPIARMNKRK